MDEILHIPQQEEKAQRLTDRVRTKMEAASAVIRANAERLRRWSDAATAGGGRIISPVHFLAAAAVLGVAAVVTTVYTPAYVVAVDGVSLGTVTSPQVFEQAVERVEDRASQILGYDYTLDHTVTYSAALVERDELTPVADIENYLFDQIDAIMKSYVLTVDGQFVGAAADRAALDQLLEDLAAPYINENTISVDYTKAVHITQEYIASDVEQDVANMMAALTANTNGQTTYEVQKGDTFMALAFDNGMTMAEMEALNPDVDINKLYIGQILNIKEEIPFLGVETVDSLTYTEAIECPVREVEDSSMYQGESKVLDAGVPGEALVTADVTYVNGVEREYPTGNYIWPVYGTITSRFGYRYIFGSYSYHSGLDIAVPYGTSVKASDGGTVTFAGYKGSYGYLVIIDHGNGEQTYYGHNSSLLVSAGDKVYQGQTIAKAGSTGRSTGNHCHFEIRINGTSVNPSAYLN